MQKLLLILSWIIISQNLQAQTKLNLRLKRELDSMYVLDQKYRALVFDVQKKETRDSLLKAFNVPEDKLPFALMQKQEAIDVSNTKRIEAIIKQYGYPGKSLVGSPANEATFFVLQHSPKIKQYLPLLEKAAQQKELPFNLYAMMLDRYLMQEGKEQIYGTQGFTFTAFNRQTNKPEQHSIIWPIKDPENVNKRRQEAGFPDTVEVNAKRMNIEYKVITMAEYNKLNGKE